MALTKIDDRGLKTPIDLLDNEKIRLGTGNDLQIYHDGSNSYIKDAGTGSIITASDSWIYWKNAAADETIIKAGANSQVELYYDNSKKFETTSIGVRVPDSQKLCAGDQDDLYIYHDGTSSYIRNSTSRLDITSGTGIGFWNADASEAYLKCTENGAVELYNNNVKTFSTNSAGINLWGPEAGDCVIDMFADEGDDNADSWRLRAGQAGVFYLQNFAPGSWDNFIAASTNAGVTLYYDNVKKFETTSGGVSITGNLGIGGTPGDYDAEADNFVVASSDHTGVTIASTGTDKRNNIYFADGTSGNAQYRGAFTYDHSDDSLLVRTAGAEVLRLDSSGRLLLGTTVEGRGTWGENLTIADSASCGMTIRSGAGSYGSLYFSDAESGAGEYTGLVEYYHQTNQLAFYTATAQRLVLDNGGNVQIIDGDLKIGATGHGIDFSAAQTNATGMTSETLDSYEEGTWSPTLNVGTATWAFCKYIRVGRLVQVWGRMSAPTAGNATGIVISSLPFGANQSSASGSLMAKDLNATTSTTVYINSDNNLYFYGINSGNAWTSATWADCTANTEVYFQGTYLTD